jgi:hypothetical protein
MAATKPKAVERITVVDIDGEAVVYDPKITQLHYLNSGAALVLDLCDGTASMKQMAEAIADVYRLPVEETEKQVRRAVRELRFRSLLEPTGKQAADEASAGPDEASLPDAREKIRMEVPRRS